MSGAIVCARCGAVTATQAHAGMQARDFCTACTFTCVQSSAPELPEIWRDQFLVARAVPGCGLCAVQRFAFTCGLLTELSFDGMFYDYRARYCYPSQRDALRALMTWDGCNDPPGDWIKEKVADRQNPRGHE